MYKLYYYPNNASLAPHFLLHHMQLNYELVLVDRKTDSHKNTDYLKLNPAGRIPTLVDDNVVIFESSAICIHLCEQHVEHELIPALGTQERPLFFQWLAYLNNTLQSDLMVRIYPHRYTDDASGISHIVIAQDKRIREALLILDEALVDKQYLLGSKISACDYFLFMLANWVHEIDSSMLKLNYLENYLKRLSQLPSIEAVCCVENIDLTHLE